MLAAGSMGVGGLRFTQAHWLLGLGAGEQKAVGEKPPGLASSESCFFWLELGFLLRFLPPEISVAGLGSGRSVFPSVCPG